MKKSDLKTTYARSEDVVAREIEGELIIVPLTAGIGDMENELFTVNAIGKVIWEQLDGKTSLQKLIDKLTVEFQASSGEIEKDVTGFVAELLKRKMIVKSPSA